MYTYEDLKNKTVEELNEIIEKDAWVDYCIRKQKNMNINEYSLTDFANKNIQELKEIAKKWELIDEAIRGFENLKFFIEENKLLNLRSLYKDRSTIR